MLLFDVCACTIHPLFVRCSSLFADSIHGTTKNNGAHQSNMAWDSSPSYDRRLFIFPLFIHRWLRRSDAYERAGYCLRLQNLSEPTDETNRMKGLGQGSAASWFVCWQCTILAATSDWSRWWRYHWCLTTVATGWMLHYWKRETPNGRWRRVLVVVEWEVVLCIGALTSGIKVPLTGIHWHCLIDVSPPKEGRSVLSPCWSHLFILLTNHVRA